MDENKKLAEYAVNLKYEDIPQDVIQLVKEEILDTIGVSCAGANEAIGQKLIPLAQAWGGKAEASVIGGGIKVPAVMAALVNGSTAQALDYDAIAFSTGHVGVCIIPALLAAAELAGNANGREIITAATVGIDVMCRFGEASKPMIRASGWLYTPVFGCFGATAAAGRLLGLDAEEMLNAFGIAYSQAAGSRQPVTEGCLVKPMQSGFAARTGVLSAILAKRGVTGSLDFITGKFGLSNQYLDGDFCPEILVKDFGTHFCARDLAFKNHPACGATECSVEAALNIAEKYEFTASDIESVTVRCGEYSRNVCEPLAAKQNPVSGPAAVFSIPWTVAIALTKKRFTLQDSAAHLLEDEEVRLTAKKVTAIIDLETDKNHASFPGRVELRLKDGRVLEEEVKVGKGHPTRPMSVAELREKACLCNEIAKKKQTDESMEKIMDLIMSLEKEDGIDKLMEFIR